MITLTGPAIEVIRSLTMAPGVAEKSGLRIVHADGSGSLTLTVAPGPEHGDEIVEADGVRVFLEGDVAEMLDGQQLDATVDDRGVAFRVLVQE